MTTDPTRPKELDVRPTLSLARQSLALDRRTLTLSAAPAATRRALVRRKAAALVALARGRTAVLRVGGVGFALRTANEVGTVQSSVCDVHDDLIRSGVLGSSGAVVVDVGANIGQFTAAVLLFAPTAEVLAIEPDPLVHERLAAHLSGSPDVRTSCVAVGATPGRGLLQRAVLPVMSTLRTDALPGHEIVGTVEVDVTTLDLVTEQLGHVDLLKVDVEGFELEALRGADRLLGRTRFLLLELGLGRDPAGGNLEVLDVVRRSCPRARILRFGRPLGDAASPLCQDVLIELWPQ